MLAFPRTLSTVLLFLAACSGQDPVPEMRVDFAWKGEVVRVSVPGNRVPRVIRQAQETADGPWHWIEWVEEPHQGRVAFAQALVPWSQVREDRYFGYAIRWRMGILDPASGEQRILVESSRAIDVYWWFPAQDKVLVELMQGLSSASLLGKGGERLPARDIVVAELDSFGDWTARPARDDETYSPRLAEALEGVGFPSGLPREHYLLPARTWLGPHGRWLYGIELYGQLILDFWLVAIDLESGELRRVVKLYD